MSFLRRLVPGLPGRGDDSDEEGEGEALLEHEEDYSSSESESSSNQDEAMERMDNGGESDNCWGRGGLPARQFHPTLQADEKIQDLCTQSTLY